TAAEPPAKGAFTLTLSVRTILAILLGLVVLLSLPVVYLLTHREDKPAGEQLVAEGNRPRGGPEGVRPKGVVVGRTNDPVSAEFFRHERLVARDRRTAEVVALEQTNNFLPLGEYTLESALPPGFRVSPQQFTVSADRSVYITLTHMPPPG